MKKILLTGGDGFFCTRFRARYEGVYEIISTDKDNLDITNEEKVMDMLLEVRPDIVIHAAAIAVTDFCNKHPEVAHKINVDGAVNVAKACKEVGAKLVFLSSEQVFNGNIERGPYDENHAPVPDTVYGQNKLEAEGLLKEIIEELWVLRFTWLFGLPQDGLNIVSNIMWDTVSALLKGEKIYASPNEYRGMTYAKEMVNNFEKVFDLPYGTYHIGANNELSRYEIVKTILIEMGLEHRIDEVLVKDSEKYKENPRDVRLNTNKIQSNGLQFTNTREALISCIKDYKLNFK